MPRKQGKNLTTRQKQFIAALPLVDWVASEAIKKAGYNPKNDEVAMVMGSELLKVPKVSEAIEKIKEARLKKMGIHAEKILSDRVRVARADVREFFNPNGTLKPTTEWTDEMAGCVGGLEVIETFEGKGDEKIWTGYLKKLKLNDRNPAQRDLMDHARLFPDRTPKVDVSVGVTEIDITNLELSAKVIYLLKVALERKKAKELENKPEGNENGVVD